ncbi:MAG: hypothetical protein IJO29_05890 [Oscillospiraceae bacterium]|nr:hypothetical protein [Oscillospiraceae bacterium]
MELSLSSEKAERHQAQERKGDIQSLALYLSVTIAYLAEIPFALLSRYF